MPAMRTDTPQPVRLSEYKPPAFLIDEVLLEFQLEPAATRVKARLAIRRNGEHTEPLVLDGVRLKPISVAIDGRVLEAGAYEVGEEHLTVPSTPDVFSLETEVEIDKAAYPRLLSNGNLVEAGDLPDGRHFAIWNDPFPKPCYLFALVAGELDELADSLVTMSGRTVDLRIYVDPGLAHRAVYAMDALKRSMKWDEEAFGREYDLDLFMIV